MSAPSALIQGGSLRLLMNEVVTVANALNPAIAAAKTGGLVPADLPDLEVHRWRPNNISPPAIYHLIAPSPFVQQDFLRWRDTINLSVQIAVAYGSDAVEMDWLEAYTDIWRDTIDPLLVGGASATPRPFNGAAEWAERTDMRSISPVFNDVSYAGMEFIVQARLDRLINS